MKTKWQTQCEELAEKMDIHVMFFEDCNRTPVEDDGNLHITKRGLRACFGVGRGQTLDGKEQNKLTREVLTALKMEKFINDETLVDETDDDADNYCEHCGRGH